MTTGIPRVIVITASLLAAATAAAAGGLPLVRIDTEQKAAAALITANHTATESPQNHEFALWPVVSLAMRALQTASQATTPVALMATPGGVEVACSTSGSMTASMAPRTPRVLKFEWRQCQFQQDGYNQALDGTGEILLLSDSFTPDKVGSIRFGSAGRDLVQTQDSYLFPQFKSHNDYIRNLLVVGNIPMKHLDYAIANSFTAFTYLVNGLSDFTQTNQNGSNPPYSYGSRLTFDAVTYSGSYAYNEDATRYDDDLTALFGKLTFTRRDSPPYGTTNEVYRYLGFHVHNMSNWTAGEFSQAVDGYVDFTWNPNFGAGCVNGGYDFKTRVPMHQVLLPDFHRPYDSGELVINGTEKVSLYSAANVRPSLPSPTSPTLLHIDAAGVGSFNYQINDLLLDLLPVSDCQ